MKRLLIVCDIFPPAFAPRMGYLCKYIRALGWEPVVLAERIPEQTFACLAGTCRATFVDFYPSRRLLPGRLQWAAVQLLDLLFHYKDRRMARAAEKLLEEQPFDLVLCSTYRTFPLRAALRAAQRHGLPLVADLRDIIEQYSGTEYLSHSLPRFLGLHKAFAALFKRQNLRSRNRVLRQARAVTTVSPWHVRVLKRYNPHTHLIYNGFDPELFAPRQLPTPQFTITYTGRLLSTAMRDPSLLFQALARLLAQGVLTPHNCRVAWYVDPASQATIQAEALRAGVLPFMDFKGYVPASAVPEVLNRSSVLLLLTNKSGKSGPRGVMTTKFFESLAVEKPILCVRSDEGVLEAALHEARAGLAARTVEEVCTFLQDHFHEWEQKGYTTSQVRKEVLLDYSRPRQAQQFATLFSEVTDSTAPSSPAAAPGQ